MLSILWAKDAHVYYLQLGISPPVHSFLQYGLCDEIMQCHTAGLGSVQIIQPAICTSVQLSL